MSTSVHAGIHPPGMGLDTPAAWACLPGHPYPLGLGLDTPWADPLGLGLDTPPCGQNS